MSRPTDFGVGGSVHVGAVHLYEAVGMWWLSQRLGTIGDAKGHRDHAIAAKHRKALNTASPTRVERP